MKYKVTKVYEVEAANKQEAVDKVVKDPNTLMYVSVTEVTNKGFWQQAKSQLTGK